MSAPSSLPEGLAERLHTVHVGVRSELEVSRHIFSGEPVYVVSDPITFQSHKLTPGDYQVFVAINSNEELGQTFKRLCELGRLDAEQEESFFQFVINLNQLGLLTLPVSDGASLYSRFAKRRASERRAAILGALFLRVPLVQPDAFLDRTARWFRPMFTTVAFVIWLICVAGCGCLVIAQRQDFVDPLGSLLAIHNLPVLWSLLVTLKIVHEFGHAYACKVLGGKVPEMGAFFIVFTPCAYVDASASWGFTSKFHRVLVALGGMYFESIVAMLALVVWAFTGPGIIHSAAQHAVVLSTIVTIGFNINPLMKYDGYYIVSDLLGMPDLRNQAQIEWTSLCKRVLFGIKTTTTDSTRKRNALACFGFAMSIYKVTVVFGISIMIAFKFPAVGIAIAGFYVLQTLWQFGQRMWLFFQSEEIMPVRRRACVVTGLIVGASFSLLLFFPVPGSPQALGVMGREHEHTIHAPTSGVLVANLVEDGQEIGIGDYVCRLQNSELAEALKQKAAEIQQLRIDFQEYLNSDVVQAVSTGERIESLMSWKQKLQRDTEKLNVQSPVGGRVSNVHVLRDLGRYVKNGEPLVRIGNGRWIIKSLVTAEDVSIAKPKVGDSVLVRLVGDSGPIHKGTIHQVSVAGSTTIDEEALTHLAGGPIPVNGSDMESANPFFRVTVVLSEVDENSFRNGMTAWVQFASSKPVCGTYIWRRLLGILNKLRTTA